MCTYPGLPGPDFFSVLLKVEWGESGVSDAVWLVEASEVPGWLLSIGSWLDMAVSASALDDVSTSSLLVL